MNWEINAAKENGAWYWGTAHDGDKSHNGQIAQWDQGSGTWFLPIGTTVYDKLVCPEDLFEGGFSDSYICSGNPDAAAARVSAALEGHYGASFQRTFGEQYPLSPVERIFAIQNQDRRKITSLHAELVRAESDD